MTLNNDQALDIYRKILRIRRVEETIANRYGEQEMRCPVHLSIGQEATPVAVCMALKPTDYMVSSHRAHAHYLAKGGDLRALISELYGKASGCAKGQGGSMHLIDLGVNFLGATSIVAGTVPVGVGAAFGAVLKGEDRISVVCIGDTVLEEGVLYESMNYAALQNLPVLFMCENNGYSCYSPLKNRQPDRPLTHVPKAFNIATSTMDGNHAEDIYTAMLPIVDKIRREKIPYFVEYKTYRYLEHCGPANDNHLKYRPEAEIKNWEKNDALLNSKAYLKQKGAWTDAWGEKVEKEIKTEIDEAFSFAQASPFPEKSELGAYVYAE